jgi:hypothetical protein
MRWPIFEGQYLDVEAEPGLERGRVNLDGGPFARGHPLKRLVPVSRSRCGSSFVVDKRKRGVAVPEWVTIKA